MNNIENGFTSLNVTVVSHPLIYQFHFNWCLKYATKRLDAHKKLK